MNVTFGKKFMQQKYDFEFEYDTKSNAGYYNNKVLFWTDTTLFVFIGLITTVGNGLVLYAAYGNKNHGPLRYLDSAIKSLALTDMLFGFIGTPLIILGYYTASIGGLKDHIKDWKIEVQTFIPNALETNSILHVTLIVFLRLLAVTEPIKCKQIHKSIRHKSIILIWMMAFGVRALALVIQKYIPDAFYYFRFFLLHGFHTFPLLLIIVMYQVFIRTLKKRSQSMDMIDINSRKTVDSMNKKMAVVVRRIILALLICYIPFLVWEQYYLIISERVPFKIYRSEIAFVGIARPLMVINSCINPFIYAWTIPAFRDIINQTIFRAAPQVRKDFEARAYPVMYHNVEEQKNNNRLKKMSYSMTYV